MKAKGFFLQKAESAYFERHAEYERALTKEQKRKINCCLNCEKDPSECNGDCELMKRRK